MGQNKTDNDFRDKLNQREIKPSENAWDRLDAMLTVAEEKKPKRSYGWLYIAASFIGFLLIATVFFSQTEEMIDIKRNPVVIDHNNQEPVEKETVIQETIPTVQQSETIAAVSNPKHTKEIKIKTINSTSTINQTPEIIITRAAGEQAVGNQTSNPELIANINQKTEQQTTPVKVDELLASVAKTPIGNAKPSVKVNAKSLLSQVDGEVNLSFREKMLRTARRNYQEVAEAVSTRNTQQ
ncbi:MAG TPA: hypothetical protein VK476_05245 [Flavobacterium sp.]|nr:hypothetical protein [Flavobacterium sp.]